MNSEALKEMRKLSKKLSNIGQEILKESEKLGSKDMKKRWDTYDIEYDLLVVRTKKDVTITASGTEVLFYEFGTGLRYSSLIHPEASRLGYGAGTFPGKGHWDNPGGWWYEHKDGRKESARTMQVVRGGEDKVLGHTFGLPAYMPTYTVGQVLLDFIKEKYGGEK